MLFLKHVKVRVGVNHHGVFGCKLYEELQHLPPGQFCFRLRRFIVLRRG